MTPTVDLRQNNINQFNFAGREFEELGKLAIKVQDSEFVNKILQLEIDTNANTQSRAKWVLKLIN